MQQYIEEEDAEVSAVKNKALAVLPSLDHNHNSSATTMTPNHGSTEQESAPLARRARAYNDGENGEDGGRGFWKGKEYANSSTIEEKCCGTTSWLWYERRGG